MRKLFEIGGVVTAVVLVAFAGWAYMRDTGRV